MCLPIPVVDKAQTRLYPDQVKSFTNAVASLSNTEQNLLYLRDYQEVPIKRIAALYGLTPTATQKRLNRIHRKLEQSYVAQLEG